MATAVFFITDYKKIAQSQFNHAVFKITCYKIKPNKTEKQLGNKLSMIYKRVPCTRHKKRGTIAVPKDKSQELMTNKTYYHSNVVA